MNFSAQNVVNVRMGRAELTRVLRKLPEIAAGGGEGQNLAAALLVRVGMTILSRIRAAFVVKSRGGTDEAGERWKPLKPETIAYSRRHPGIPRKRPGSAPSYMLTEKQKQRWYKLYGQFLAAYKGDKGHAAAHAWFILKSEGAKTLLGTYGSTQVEILRDTGLLINSLTPGIDVSSMASVPPKKPHQVFQLGKGEVIIGTNRKGAAAHHHGVPGRLPQRRLWPEPRKWPRSWWQDALEQARQGLIHIAIYFLR